MKEATKESAMFNLVEKWQKSGNIEDIKKIHLRRTKINKSKRK